MTDTEDKLVEYWSIHSSKDEQPMFRDWARSQSEAESKLETIKREEESSEDEYWIIQMTESELASYRAMGQVPEDA